MTTDRSRPLRKDAAENRTRLLASARELFATRGLDVTLNDIAHHAGVGVGTAYRRFANKGEVLDALFEDHVAEIGQLADAALADPDPWRALATYLEGVIALQVRDKAIAHILSGSRVRPEQRDWSRDNIAPKVNAIAERAVDAGAVRPDATGTDLVFVQMAVIAIAERVEWKVPGLWRRYLWLMLDGLRAIPEPPLDLPVPALTTDATHAALGSPES